jgi:hypothetical protein
MDLTSYGRTDSNSGRSGTAESLRVTNPVPITTWQADVTVKSVEVVGCAANPTSTYSKAQLFGGFFNDGTSPGPGDRTGDIFAIIAASMDTITGDRIEAFFNRCTNANCTTVIAGGSHVFSTKWTKGVANTLSIQWDQPNHRFIFTVNPGPNQEQVALPYTFPDTNPPVLNFKDLDVANGPASCMGPSLRTSATMKALFDNVMVNP